MILNGKKLKCTPFTDSRGHYGESGQLHIAEDIRGTKFLVKSNPADVTNEYVVHRLARSIGVPTSDAVLIDNGSFRAVEADIKSVKGIGEKRAEEIMRIFEKHLGV